ncbi:MAG: DUF177 domain-containing protein [Nitrospiraceae bacterium]|nr:DUF177 domain-containing protein [Nitrospiraceae bacterium]
MKILIADIPDEGLEVDIAEKMSIDDVSPPSPVKARLDVAKAEQEIIIAGSLQAELQLQCSRCLRDFRRSLDIPVNVVYHPLEEKQGERHGLKDDEMDLGFYRDEIDLQDLFREQILLNTQMKPLCDEQCKGICPHCGTDLNISGCACGSRQTDPRLEVLRKLLDKGKE